MAMFVKFEKVIFTSYRSSNFYTVLTNLRRIEDFVPPEIK